MLHGRAAWELFLICPRSVRVATCDVLSHTGLRVSDKQELQRETAALKTIDVGHCLCLVFPTAFVAKALPLPCLSHCLRC